MNNSTRTADKAQFFSGTTRIALLLGIMACSFILCLSLSGCAEEKQEQPDEDIIMDVSDVEKKTQPAPAPTTSPQPSSLPNIEIHQDFSHADQFNHGVKTAEYQKYIVLHDTEGSSDAQGVISYWASNGNKIAAHFIVNRDGSIWQCVDMDQIGHHVGFGNTGHNAEFGVTDESRDDKAGTKSIGGSYADYGMNSYSIGIEMVHVGGGAEYTEAQLNAVDDLIAYIDAYYGFESTIIDHKDWRNGNSDTSPEFKNYLANYKDHRTHN